MPIAYQDPNANKTLVANLAPGVTPEQAANAMNLAPGSWREITEEEAAELQKPSDEELAAQRAAAFNQAIVSRLNAFAAAREYDDITSARLASLTTEYQADGQAANHAYETTWDAAIPLFTPVTSGETSVEEAVASLPALAWPDDDDD